MTFIEIAESTIGVALDDVCSHIDPIVEVVKAWSAMPVPEDSPEDDALHAANVAMMSIMVASQQLLHARNALQALVDSMPDRTEAS